MPKIKIFLWQLCHKTLPLRGTLFSRGLNVSWHKFAEGFFSRFQINASCEVAPPPHGLVKLNFGGLLINSLIASGFILHVWIGRVLKVGSAHYGVGTILVAERQRYCEMVFMQQSKWTTNFIVEDNNTMVIQTLEGKIQITWQIHNIINDILTWKEIVFKLSLSSIQMGKYGSRLAI